MVNRKKGQAFAKSNAGSPEPVQSEVQRQDNLSNSQKPLFGILRKYQGNHKTSAPAEIIGAKKKVRILDPVLATPSLVPSNSPTQRRILKDLCLQIQSSGESSEPEGKDEVCVGCLETTNYDQLVYTNCLSSPSFCPNKTLLPLAGLFTGLVDRAHLCSSVPYYKRLSIAANLARSVLMFWGSPWVRSSWTSHDVLFPGAAVDDESDHADVDRIFVEAVVKESNLSEDSVTSLRPFAPNALLFGLGVMLLELSFETAWQNMQDDNEHEAGPHSEFFTVTRMSKKISPTLGITYANIVQKCLRCDFGHGDDLSNPALQEAFYREVVLKLEQLENSFRTLFGS